MYVATSSRSGISMEAWLPEQWTGRFLSTGNGGLDGCIQYVDVAYATALGFATVGANNGHNGTSGEPFYNNPDVVTDFAWRSIHTNVVIGKEIVQQFYGQAQHKSYYLGCSTGGREGIKSAQMFPNDFDGIVAGAPAVAFNNLSAWSGHFLLLTGTPDSSTFVSFEQWNTIVASDIMAQCDGIDGVLDGIIEDPLLCDYRPESLICSGSTSNASTCLTPEQALTVRLIFQPLYGNGGHLVYPRMQPGSELNGAPEIYYNGEPFPYTSDWYRYAVYNNPNWNAATIGPNDYDAAYTIDPGDIESWDGNLAPYRDAGGKLLHYHGQADPIISSDNSPRYYDHVSRTMGQKSSELDSFYRFFRISGMSHCAGGAGAWMIGQTSAGNATLDPSGNVLTAMVRWVEEGTAPDTIEGLKYENDTESLGVSFIRRHCRWPYRSTYIGGDSRNPNSWTCKPGAGA